MNIHDISVAFSVTLARLQPLPGYANVSLWSWIDDLVITRVKAKLRFG